ncbi:hypothetical protein ACMCNP_01670 [Candidatus Acidulodesulfobacterium sp. H_13]|uniref:hypothetical protein n=1 Tax=Candidatus Acidulodesulfobacterium sp. H_13 TaxID=3395470 RepID=UPI003AF7C208
MSMGGFFSSKKQDSGILPYARQTAVFVAVITLVVASVFIGGAINTAHAGSNNGNSLSLYENPITGEVFLKPGSGRSKLSKHITKKLFGIKKAVSNAVPAWTKHVKLGTTIWIGYGYYNNTGFSQDLQLEENRPGPGNNNYNAFNVNRGYINFVFRKNKKWFLRVTPNIHRGQDGSAFIRLKYAYLQFNKIYDANGLTMNLKVGQTTTPLIAWEDGLLGYHFTERTPYGFLGVTSTQPGISITGRYKTDGRVYMAYNAGFFNSGGWHNNEEAEQKSPQIRLDIYPFGADSKLNGIGISGYYAWAQQNTFFPAGENHPTARAAAILHYKTPDSVIVLQYDYAINQLGGFGNINNSKGSWCGIGANTSSPGVYGCNLSGASLPFNPSKLGTSPHNTEHGLDAFGYYNIPNSKFGLFGLIQRYYYSTPQTDSANFKYGNPYDFQRVVAGIGYHFNKHITFAIDEQNYRFLNAKDYRDLPSTSPMYINYGQWMGDTNAILVQVRIAF